MPAMSSKNSLASDTKRVSCHSNDYTNASKEDKVILLPFHSKNRIKLSVFKHINKIDFDIGFGLIKPVMPDSLNWKISLESGRNGMCINQVI